MKAQISFKLILKSKNYPIPFQFAGLTDVHPDIFAQLLLSPDHKYYVNSDVSDEVFQSFVDFWVQCKQPEINIENYFQYYQLSEEFNLMKDLLLSKKKRAGTNMNKTLLFSTILL